MKPKIKKLWLKALRSGKYTKGTGSLRSDNKYCCLGVLTDLYCKQKKVGWTKVKSEISSEYLSPSVRKWSGLPLNNPEVFYKKETHTLAALNDGRISQGIKPMPFKSIANVIEKQL